MTLHLHRYQVIRDCGSHGYLQCKQCGKRRIRRRAVGGYYPVDQGWVETGEWTRMGRPPSTPSGNCGTTSNVEGPAGAPKPEPSIWVLDESIRWLIGHRDEVEEVERKIGELILVRARLAGEDQLVIEMTTRDHGPDAMYECECCDFEVCVAKSPGLGYYCQPCISHEWAGCNPHNSLAENDAELAAVEADHARWKTEGHPHHRVATAGRSNPDNRAVLDVDDARQ